MVNTYLTFLSIGVLCCLANCLTFLLFDAFSYENNDHEDFVRDLSWSPVDGCLRTCGWDTQIIRHTTAMIEEGLKINKLQTEAIETSVITKVGFNGVVSPQKSMIE